MDTTHQLMRIQRLSPLLANQIAAGEVIERPASVVKELLENSLDAMATKITLEVEQGGSQLIRVRDNGVGIHQEDLPLAISSHATSKITQLDDLHAIASLGFRGEALASVCSVAKVSISSCTKGSDAAYALEIAAGKEPIIKPSSHPVGTTIDVRELFFNTPVRRKFLRSDKTEFSHIETVARRIALSRFDCSMILKHNGKTIFNLPAANDQAARERRVAKLFGQTFMQHARFIDSQAAGMKITGWLAMPSFLRSQTDLQYFYLNGRMVRDKLIRHAVKQAYQDALYEGRHPAYLLHLTMDPSTVDVNVHPTKHEVRFQQARMVHDFLFSRLQQVVNDDVVPEFHQPSSPPIPQPAPQVNYPIDSKHIANVMQIEEPQTPYQALTPQPSAPAVGKHSTIKRNEFFGCLIGQLRQHYLLTENSQGLVVIDIARAQRAIFSKRYQQAIKANELSLQPLLLPERISLSELQADALQCFVESLQSLGLVIERVAEQVILIREVPSLLQQADFKTMLAHIADDLIRQTAATLDANKSQAIIKQIARYAHKSNNCELSTTAQQLLIQQLSELPLDEISGCYKQMVLSAIIPT